MIYESERRNAIAAGLKRFDPGVPCSRGHIAERYAVSGSCVECTAEARKRHRAVDPERNREKKRAYRHTRRDIERAQEREWRARNPERARSKTRKWREVNRDKELAANRAKWPEIRADEMRKKRERYANDPVYAMSVNIRSRLGYVFRNAGFSKASKTAQILGCTWPELKRHIERQFLKGMTWANRGSAWHIDHIVPFAAANTPEEIIALGHFTNLRPLWATDNIKKTGKRLHLI